MASGHLARRDPVVVAEWLVPRRRSPRCSPRRPATCATSSPSSSSPRSTPPSTPGGTHDCSDPTLELDAATTSRPSSRCPAPATRAGSPRSRSCSPATAIITVARRGPAARAPPAPPGAALARRRAPPQLRRARPDLREARPAHRVEPRAVPRGARRRAAPPARRRATRTRTAASVRSSSASFGCPIDALFAELRRRPRRRRVDRAGAPRRCCTTAPRSR